MILDKQLELSSEQAITATAFSTNAIDLKSAKDLAAGEPIHAIARTTEAFNNLTSLKIELGYASDAAGTGFVSVCERTYLLADIDAADTALPIPPLGPTSAGLTGKSILVAKFTVTGTAPTTGKVSLSIVPGTDNKPANTAVKF